MRAGFSPWRAASSSISAGRTRVGFFAIGVVFPSARNAPLRKTASSLRRLRKVTESLRSATRAPDRRDLQYHPESRNVVTRADTSSGQSEEMLGARRECHGPLAIHPTEGHQRIV